MNIPDLEEFIVKENRLHNFMNEHGYGAVVMGTQANFAWFTCGGDSHVLLSSEIGEAILVVTAQEKYCICNSMDAKRIEEQEISGLGFKLITLKWFETPKDVFAAGLIKGLRAVSDIPVDGAECNFKEFYALHYPLTKQEIERYRVMGREAEEALFSVTNAITPGMTGSDVETLLVCEFAKRKLFVACMIIGVDEEISKWRHPIAWAKPIKEYLMLVLAVRRNGLFLPITRLVHFGEVSSDIRNRFDAVCKIAADTILHCKAGVKFTDISARQKQLYTQLGYKDEWENHYVGGITGYIPNDGSLCVDEDAVMVDYQTFNWYVTITGVNTEDTMIIDGDHVELFTVNGIWPTRRWHTEKGDIDLPDILIR